jgi:hypothetical protein
MVGAVMRFVHHSLHRREMPQSMRVVAVQEAVHRLDEAHDARARVPPALARVEAPSL